MATQALLQNDSIGGLEVAPSPQDLHLGVLCEKPGECRVTMTPDVAETLIKDGYSVTVQTGAGVQASFSDAAYLAVGCGIAPLEQVIGTCGVLFRIDAPVDNFSSMSGKIVVSWVARLIDSGKEVVAQAKAANVTLVDVTAVPRISIAQKLDVLSSQAKVAGHRAVLEAAHSFGRFHQSEMTAAGKFPPSNTFILGCGVAGLAAIGTSRALGSVVRAWDVRDVHDQVESMGGRWVTVDFKEDATGTGGYAKESSQEFLRAQRDTFHRHLKECDIVITTAAIPGKKSPLLVTEDMVQDMKPGSVIVDLAAIGGGNCSLTKQDQLYKTPNGVTIIGYADLPSRMASQASQMYAQNMMQLLRHVHGKDKAVGFVRNLYGHLEQGEQGDVVSRTIVCCRDGKDVKPPPPPKVGPPPAPKAAPKAKPKPQERPLRDAVVLSIVMTLFVLMIVGMGEGAPVTVIRSFLLAGAAGYQAVWGVAHALHTPLMSVTNAISGMTVIGGMHLYQQSTSSPMAQYLGGFATAVSAINIVGGFVITQRMLNLFRRKTDVDHSGLMIIPCMVLTAWSIWTSLYRRGDEAKLKSEIEVQNTISSLLCIMSIASLATMKSANLGCKFGMFGVFCALVTMFASFSDDLTAFGIMAGLVGIGGLFGLLIGYSVTPIALPQTVAAFHSLVGLAAMVTSIGIFYENPIATKDYTKNVSILLGNFIGGITLTGSLVAFGKLSERLSSKELNLPCKNYLNLLGLCGCIFMSYVYLTQGDGELGKMLLWGIAGLSCLMGLHLVGSVGGGDMPVCITVLNSYSGWALAAEGFNLNVPMLAVVGSIIGFSGAILTKIMCDAMNRDIFNVIFGGMNVAAPVKSDNGEKKVHVETKTPQVAELLANSKEVMIVPGYGMAVARAQNAVGEVAKTLRDNGINCIFCIHPVAGRMPGQMNVLLAEAGVSYDWVKEMDECKSDMEKYDVCMVMGANDITNSAAQEVEGCAIWGMPVIEVWRAKKTIFCKRSMGGGYAALDNPVFFKENTMMLLGDANKTASALSTELKECLGKV